MSSFKRKIAQSIQKPPYGTKFSPSSSTIVFTSTGIPSLDDILGGGMQLGTDLVIFNSDPHSAHSDLLQKYFIAQGIASNHEVHVIDPGSRNLIESCVWSSSISPSTSSIAEEDLDATKVEEDKVKIAWRYERMQKFKTTVSSTSQEDYCRYFDLTCQIPTAVIETSLSSGLLRLADDIFQKDNNVYDTVLNHIEDALQVTERSTPQRVVRISIPSFASPLWGDAKFDVVLGFLLRLRLLLRKTNLACALINFPSYLSSDAQWPSDWKERLGWCTDGCLSLNGFTSDPSMNVMFPSHHGLLTIHHLPRVQALVPASDRFSTLRGLSSPSSSVMSGGVGENNLAYKCTRRRLIFETLHLDVEGGVGERRTTPSASTSQFIENGPSDSLPSDRKAGDIESSAAVPIAVDDSRSSTKPVDWEHSNMAPNSSKQEMKKPKKRVGFQVDRPDLYDF